LMSPKTGAPLNGRFAIHKISKGQRRRAVPAHRKAPRNLKNAAGPKRLPVRVDLVGGHSYSTQLEGAP
jgi:hypothetical protein